MRVQEQEKTHPTREQDEPKVTAEREPEQETKFAGAGGKPPPVQQGFNDANGTSQLAFEEDENEKELKTKVSKLVSSKFGGDYKKAFGHYDADKDGAVSKSELVNLLSDANVGNGLTRGIWASKIIDKLDQNNDLGIQWAEFESVFRTHA